MKVLVFGETGCGQCAVYKGTAAKPGIAVEVEAMLKAQGIGYTYYDAKLDRKAYDAGKKIAGIASAGDYPAVFVLDDKGIRVGNFIARQTVVRPFTASQMVAKIKALCPECCDGCAETVPETPVPAKTCTRCGGTGKKVTVCAYCKGTGVRK